MGLGGVGQVRENGGIEGDGGEGSGKPSDF